MTVSQYNKKKISQEYTIHNRKFKSHAKLQFIENLRIPDIITNKQIKPLQRANS